MYKQLPTLKERKYQEEQQVFKEDKFKLHKWVTSYNKVNNKDQEAINMVYLDSNTTKQCKEN